MVNPCRDQSQEPVAEVPYETVNNRGAGAEQGRNMPKNHCSMGALLTFFLEEQARWWFFLLILGCTRTIHHVSLGHHIIIA